MIIVIGGGPAGLTTAYYLQQRGLHYLVLEKAQIGHAWASHYDSLRLHTLKGVSALPGLPMPDSYPNFPSRAQMWLYLQAYAQHFNLNVDTGVTVERTFRENGRWHLQTSRGSLTADTVIVATGIWSTPRRPHFEGEAAFNGRILHANAYQNPKPFHGRRVLVIGAGNTGAEIAAELGEAGVTTGIVVRSGVNFVPYPTSAAAMRFAAQFARTAPSFLTDAVLRRIRPDFTNLGLPPHPDPPSEAYPVVGYKLPDAVAAGKVTVYGDVDHFTREGVAFADGRIAPFNAVILATGYRPTIDFIEPTPILDEMGRVVGDGRHPHLYTVGFHYPATEGWLQAIGREARHVVAEVVQKRSTQENEL